MVEITQVVQHIIGDVGTLLGLCSWFLRRWKYVGPLHVFLLDRSGFTVSIVHKGSQYHKVMKANWKMHTKNTERNDNIEQLQIETKPVYLYTTGRACTHAKDGTMWRIHGQIQRQSNISNPNIVVHNINSLLQGFSCTRHYTTEVFLLNCWLETSAHTEYTK